MLVKRIYTKLMNWIYKSGRRNYYIAKVIKTFYRFQASPKEKKMVEENISLFVSEKLKHNKKYIKKIEQDIWFSQYYYLCTPDEYFLYNFENKSDKERKKYVGNIEKEALCYRIPNSKKLNIGRDVHYFIDSNCEIFFDKFKSYNKFKKFYKRDVIKILEKEDLKNLDDFVQKHTRFVVKPIKSSRGQGVYVYDASGKTVECIVDEILEKGGVILEELIIPAKEIAAFHPKTVNSLRVATYLNNDGSTTILGAQMRIGVGDSFIDNLSSGGIGVGIDIDSGEVITKGYDEMGNIYEEHPDTNIKFVGFKIPYFEECKKLAVELSNVLPERKYVGWDLVLTDNGWVMMEGNCAGQFMNFQLPFQRGMREEIEKLFYQ